MSINSTAVAWFTFLIADLYQRGPRIDPKLVHETCKLGKVALEQVLLPTLPFSPVRIIPLILHAYLHLITAVIRKTSG